MVIYHKFERKTFSSINGHEKEQNASYDSNKGFEGDLRVNNRYRILTDNEVKNILFPETKKIKKKTKRKKKRKKKKRKTKKKNKKKK